MAAKQRSIAVSEFFLKNRHLLGFDSPHRALLTAIKEAVDNSLDACEEADILPEITVQIEELPHGVLSVAVEDNGPGIVEEQIARGSWSRSIDGTPRRPAEIKHYERSSRVSARRRLARSSAVRARV